MQKGLLGRYSDRSSNPLSILGNAGEWGPGGKQWARTTSRTLFVGGRERLDFCTEKNDSW